MRAPRIFRNRRRWQEAGAALLLLCFIVFVTAVFATYVPDALMQWNGIRRSYGSGTAWGLVAAFGVITGLLAIPATVFVWQTRGGVDLLLGKGKSGASTDEKPDTQA